MSNEKIGGPGEFFGLVGIKTEERADELIEIAHKAVNDNDTKSAVVLAIHKDESLSDVERTLVAYVAGEMIAAANNPLSAMLSGLGK